MNIDQAKIVIRPRTPWESMDLGIALGRHYLKPMLLALFTLFIPLYGVLLFFFWERPLWIFLIFYWLKPLFDRIPLYIVSRGIFEPTPSYSATMRYFFKSLKTGLIGDLTWRRISLMRSYLLPIRHLEGLNNRQRNAQRARVFRSRPHRAAWLTIVFLHFETILASGLGIFILFMIPDQLLEPIPSLFYFMVGHEFSFGQFLLHKHLFLFAYLVVLAFTESLYVICGFCLYLNQRIILEGWDIQVAFQRLARRVLGSVGAVILGLMVGLSSTLPNAAYAGGRVDLNALSFEEEREENKAALYEQEAQEAADRLKTILDSEPFLEEVERTDFRRRETSLKKTKNDPEPLPKMRMPDNNFTPGDILQMLLWIGVVLAIFVVVRYQKSWLPYLKSQLFERKKVAPLTEFQGMDIRPESLPEDLLGAFNRLWDDEPREAMSLAYRKVLSVLVHEWHVPLKKHHTEGEVIRLSRQYAPTDWHQFSAQVIHHWEQIAYAHERLDDGVSDAINAKWSALQQSPTKEAPHA